MPISTAGRWSSASQCARAPGWPQTAMMMPHSSAPSPIPWDSPAELGARRGELQDGISGTGAPALRRLRLIHPQDFDCRRRDKDLAEGAHQFSGVLARAAAVAHLVELIEMAQLD